MFPLERNKHVFVQIELRPCESGYALQLADLHSVYCSVKVAKLHELYIPTHPLFFSFLMSTHFWDRYWGHAFCSYILDMYMESLSNDFSFTSLSVSFSLPVVLGSSSNKLKSRNKVLSSSAGKDDQR